MTPADVQQNAVFPETPTVFGIRMEPFAVGHGRALAAMDAGSSTIVDAVRTAIICSGKPWRVESWLRNPLKRWLVALRCIRIGMLCRRDRLGKWEESQAQKLMDYIEHHCKGPDVQITGQAIESDCPLWESVMVFLMSRFGMTEREAASVPANKALAWYYIALESDGLCKIVDFDAWQRKADEADELIRKALDG